MRELKWPYYSALFGGPADSDRGPMATLQTAASAVSEATLGSAFAGDLSVAVGGLAVALVIGHVASPLGPLEREAVSQLLRGMTALEPRRRPALRHHRLYVLGLLADPPGGVEYRPAPSLPPLRPSALSDLAGLPELRSARADLEAAAAAASLRGEDRRQPTAQNTLSRIGALYKHQEAWESATLAVPPDAEARLVGLHRGPDPEFRDPIRFCLRDEFADPEGRRALADLFRRTLEEIDLIDLRPDLFGAALEVDAERALEAPFELVDRAWRTRRLVRPVSSPGSGGRPPQARWAPGRR